MSELIVPLKKTDKSNGEILKKTGVETSSVTMSNTISYTHTEQVKPQTHLSKTLCVPLKADFAVVFFKSDLFPVPHVATDSR